MTTITTKQIAAELVNKACEAQIRDMLQWDELDYYNYQFETGIAYLQHYIPNDPDGQEWLIHSKTFWAWWQNHWRQRDDVFMQSPPQSPLQEGVDTCRMIYREIHDPATLAKAIYPTGVVLEMSYSEMIQELFDHELKGL